MKAGPVRMGIVAACVVSCLGCGAKTGLLVDPAAHPDAFVPPDAGMDAGSDAERDAGPDTGHDAGPNCEPDVRLLPAHADVLLVLDRSGSMDFALASSATTRWQALHDSLRMTLPSFDANVAFGATIFPVPEATIGGGTVCTVAAMLDVPVALGQGPAVIAALEAHRPSGGTPTAEAIRVAAAALAARRRTGVPQSIVLATDGGPNCDPADASQPWFGQAPETCAADGVDPLLCLDTDHTVGRITDALSAGVPTYVIAMDVRETYLVAALRMMALAGGRPRSGGATPYYDVRNPDDLRVAFDDIATRVSGCSFFPDGDVASDMPTVEVDGVVVPRDDTRTDGWTRGANGTFDLFGTACTRAMGGGVVVRIVGECR